MSNNYSILQKMDNVGLLKSCLIIFLIAVAARFSYAFFFIRPEYLLLEDQGQYIKLALEFPKTGFLGITPERVPGYPLFLSFLSSIFEECFSSNFIFLSGDKSIFFSFDTLCNSLDFCWIEFTQSSKYLISSIIV